MAFSVRHTPDIPRLTSPAILDPYVTIGWAATAIPFLSPYHRLAIGLGTLAVDLGAAVLLTSALRSRLGFRLWRAVHWLAYLAWPTAFVHALTAGNDMRTGWVAATVWGSAAVLAVAVLARLVTAWRGAPVRPRSAAPRDDRVL
jgi:methionine sulfoxide reductase heme-binding subunit